MNFRLETVRDRAARAAPWLAMVMAFGIPWSRVFYRLGLVGLAACLLIVFPWQRLVDALRRERILALAMALMLWILAGLLYTKAPLSLATQDSFDYLKLLILPTLLLLAGEPLWRRRVLLAYLAGVAVLMTPTLLEGLGAFKAIGWGPVSLRNESYSPQSMVYWRNHIVHGFHVGILIACCMAFGAYDRGHRWLAGALAALGAVDIVFFIHGRAALISLAVVLLVSLLVYVKRRSIKLCALAVCAGAVATLFFMSVNFHERVLSVFKEPQGFYEQGDDASSGGIRLAFWSLSVEMFKSSPIVGTGPGQFRQSVIDEANPYHLEFFHAHNEYLSLASQHGIVGLGLLLALIAVALRRSRQLPPLERDLAWWGLLVFALNAVTDASLHNEWEGRTFVLWLYLASPLVFPRETREPAPATAAAAPAALPSA